MNPQTRNSTKFGLSANTTYGQSKSKSRVNHRQAFLEHIHQVGKITY